MKQNQLRVPKSGGRRQAPARQPLKHYTLVHWRLLIFLLFIIIQTPSTHAQQIAQTDWKADSSTRADTRAKFNELYILNSEIGFLTFGEQGHPDKRQYILNGNIVPHYYVFPRHWKVNFVLTPQVMVRIIANQNSLPVRTPSYLPGGNFYFNISKQHDAINYRYMNIGAFHHSNGQDGNPLDENGEVNLYNGNFSTNFLLIGYNRGYRTEGHNTYIKLELELHSGLANWAYEPAFDGRLSKLRLNWRWARSINTYIPRKNFLQFFSEQFNERQADAEEEKTRLVVDGMIALDDLTVDWNQRFNIEVKYYVKFRGSENTSFFASFGYRGHDKYNVYFSQPYPYFGVGMAAGNGFVFR